MSEKERRFTSVKLAIDAVAVFFVVLFIVLVPLEPLWWSRALLPWTYTYVAAIVASSVILIFAGSWLQMRYASALSARFPILEKKWFGRVIIVTILSLFFLSHLLRDIFIG